MFSQSLTKIGRWLGLGRGSADKVDERRGWGRVPSDVQTTCSPAGPAEGEALPVLVKNVSPGGICLMAVRSFRLGGLLAIQVPQSAEQDTEEVLACVVRCGEVPGQGWELGCTFASPLSEEEIGRFTAQPETSVSDRRTHTRCDREGEATYRIVRSGESPAPNRATVLNISAGGLALRVPEAIGVGTLLSVELSDARSKPVLTALASVVRASVSQSGERIVGCNFIRSLPEEQFVKLLE